MREEIKDKSGKLVAVIEDGKVTVLEPENIAQVMYDTGKATIAKVIDELNKTRESLEAHKKALKFNL